jgi:hypothetical protein
MGVIVLVTDQDAFASSPHTVLHIVFLQSLQPGEHGWIFFRLPIFCSKCIVAEWV